MRGITSERVLLPCIADVVYLSVGPYLVVHIPLAKLIVTKVEYGTPVKNVDVAIILRSLFWFMNNAQFGGQYSSPLGLHE